jgi:cysteine-rich repeat protein
MRVATSWTCFGAAGLLFLGACKGDGGGANTTSDDANTFGTSETGSESSSTETGDTTESTGDTTESESSTDDDSCPPGELDCPCDADSCIDPYVCEEGICTTLPECGNGDVETDEACDDGNDVDNDGCNNDCTNSSMETWSVTYDSTDGDDEAHDVFVDNDNDVYVTGYRSTAANGTNLLVLKYEADGTLAWAVDFDGPANADDVGFGVVATSNDVYVVGRTAIGGAAADDIFLIKLAALDGASDWVVVVDGNKVSGNDEGADVALDSGGDIYVSGTIDQDTSNKDIWVARYDPDGNQVWAQTFEGDDTQTDRGQSITLDAADNVLVTGRRFVTGEGPNVFVAKLGSNLGNELWSNSDTVGSTDVGWGIGADSNGRAIVSATVSGTGDDAWVRAYTAAGAEDMTYDPSATGDDEARRVAVDSDDEIVFAGWRPGADGTDGVIQKIDADGIPVWTHSYVGANPGDEQAWGIAVGSSDQVAVAGSETGANDLDIWVMQLEP